MLTFYEQYPVWQAGAVTISPRGLHLLSIRTVGGWWQSRPVRGSPRPGPGG